MIRRSWLIWVALVLGAAPPTPAQGPPRTPDYKVAIWYKRSDPLGTFKHREYDLRKGQYDARKVNAWLDTIRTDHPADFAYVLDVSLGRQSGATEAEKLESAIRKEYLEMAAIRPIPHAPLSITPTTARVPSLAPASSMMAPVLGAPTGFQHTSRLSPGAGGNPAGYQPRGPTFPVPFPYPRPHP